MDALVEMATTKRKVKTKLLVAAFMFAQLPDDASWKDKAIQYGLLWDPFSGKLPHTTQLAVMERTETYEDDGTLQVKLVCCKTYSCKEGDPSDGGGVSVLYGNRTFQKWENGEFYVINNVSKQQFRAIDSFFQEHSGEHYSTLHRSASYWLPAFVFSCVLRPGSYVDPDKSGYRSVSKIDAPVWTCASVVLAALNSANLLTGSTRTSSPWDLRHLMRVDHEFASLIPTDQVLCMLKQTNA